MSEQASDGGGGRGFRFWKKKKPQQHRDQGRQGQQRPADASKTGCGGFFSRRRGKGNGTMAPGDKEPLEAANGSSQPQPQPSATVEITFADVELPVAASSAEAAAAAAAAAPPATTPADAEASDASGSSVHSVCEEVVRVKVQPAQSAWVRPPVAAPVAGAAASKPKLSLAKMAVAKDDVKEQQPRRPSVEKPPPPPPPSAEPTAEDATEAAERQRAAEARFQRKSVDMRSVKAKGGVKIESSPQSEFWWSVVNKSLVGTGLFSRAAVCSLNSGGVFACNPAEFAPTADQAAALRDNLQNPDAFSAAGFAVGGAIYKVEPDGCAKDLLSAVNLAHTEGLLVTKTKTALVIGGFTGGRDQARETLVDMRDLFASQGL